MVLTYGEGNRKIKCKFCGVSDTPKSELIMITRRTPKKELKEYYHDKCYPNFLKEKAESEKESRQKDELNETLKELFMRPQMGTPVWMLISAVRNGDEIGLINGRYKAQRYREGVTYDKLNEAFKYSADDIDWALRNKDFNNAMTEFKYCLQIAVGNLIHVETKEENYERVAKHLELMGEPDEDEYVSSFNYEVDKDENDISFLFED